MRQQLADVLPAVRRPAGVAAGVSFAAAVLAAATPWIAVWALDAEVRVSGTADVRVLATLSGAEATPMAWAALVAGTIAAVAAVSVALDMPVPAAEPIAIAASLALATVAVLLAVDAPTAEAFADRGVVRDLLGETGSLPVGVAIDLVVRPATGLWTVAASSLAVALGTSVAVRRG